MIEHQETPKSGQKRLHGNQRWMADQSGLCEI